MDFAERFLLFLDLEYVVEALATGPEDQVGHSEQPASKLLVYPVRLDYVAGLALVLEAALVVEVSAE